MIMKSLLAARFSHLLKQTSTSSVTKLTMTDLEAKMQLLEVTIKHLDEKRVQEQKYTELESKMREKSLERHFDEIGKKLISLEQLHSKEIEELKAKNQTLTEENKAFARKLENAGKKIDGFAKEIALLKRQQKLAVSWNEVKADILWDSLEPCQKSKETNHHRFFLPFKMPLLEQIKRLGNPAEGNHWNQTYSDKWVQIDELEVTVDYDLGDRSLPMSICAVKGFPISEPHCRADNFPGTILYYFEVIAVRPYDKVRRRRVSNESCNSYSIGFSNGNIDHFQEFGKSPNTYAFTAFYDYCLLSGEKHQLKCPIGAIKPEWNDSGWVLGCGLLLSPDNKLAIFFTLDGMPLCKQIPISHPPGEDALYPTIRIDQEVCLEANFGDDLANKPFKYDIETCPGMVFDNDGFEKTEKTFDKTEETLG